MSDEFGIPLMSGHTTNTSLKDSDIFFTSVEWEDENPGIFERIGTKLGVIDKNNRITLHTQGAQVLQKFITNKNY